MKGLRKHGGNKEPYKKKTPIRGWLALEGSLVDVLMNPDLTPQGNPSRRVSFVRSGTWYYIDDEELRAEAIRNSEAS